MIDAKTASLLRESAAACETETFLSKDPSCFMHKVEGPCNIEATAFVASVLSFGSRSQFMPKIAHLVELAGGNVDRWIRDGVFANEFAEGDGSVFYRFFTRGDFAAFLWRYNKLMVSHGTLKGFVRTSAPSGNALDAMDAVCGYFSHGAGGLVPKYGQSACKRLAMFMRWMVRSGSPVDTGLWADIIDRRTLIVPMDVHVLKESKRLGLIDVKSASMSAARRLTAMLSRIFPDDPCKGDFALYGASVSPWN